MSKEQGPGPIFWLIAIPFAIFGYLLYAVLAVIIMLDNLSLGLPALYGIRRR